MERYRRRLELLAQGRLQEAEALVVGSSAAAKQTGGQMMDGALDDVAGDGTVPSDGGHIEEKHADVLEYDVTKAVRDSTANAKGASGLGPRSPDMLTAQTLEAMIDTIGDFFRKQPSTGKCQNCGAHNPGIKREGHSKLFLLPLTAKKRAANTVQGTEILSTLSSVSGPGGGGGGRGGERVEKKKKSYKMEVDKVEEVENDEKKGDTKFIKKTESDSDEGESDSGDELDPRLYDAPEDKSDSSAPKFLTPSEVRDIMRRMWKINEPMLAYIYPTDVARRERRRNPSSHAPYKGATRTRKFTSEGYRDFFVQTVPVAPNRFRPVNHVGEAVYEHPQNTLLTKMINANIDLVDVAAGRGRLAPPPDPTATTTNNNNNDNSQQSLMLSQTLRLWLELQNSLNALFDSTAADETHGVTGIKQQLEKKEGLFRKNMMGKRVNFAARSVISPDVFLNGGEIGVPPYFASRLSFPERVTSWNVERLREAVLAGPGRNPGAVAVEDERGRIIMLRKDKKSREAVAKTLYAGLVNSGTTPGTIGLDAMTGGKGTGSTPSPMIGASIAAPTTTTATTTATTPPVLTPAASLLPRPASSSDVFATQQQQTYGGSKVVYRTMTDGDFMLTNRQPTLHKPGMMGHRARIMRAERTIRFHYANCSTFNADFDGDEINLHLPQDHLGRAEGYDIVHADRQFFVPTDGKPLRGLIQDHIVAGTLLSMKDRFLTKREYTQLIYECIALDCSGGWDIWLEPPAIVKPRPMWTGKQVITAVLMHYTRDQLPFTMASDAKVPVDTWGKHSGEGKMHIWRNHLVAGVVDKAAFGKHGLLHIFHELYGAERTSIFTAALSRLFTGFIQQHGFTCGMSDVFLVETAEQQRNGLLATADVRALEAAAQFVNITPGPQELVSDQGLSLDKAFLKQEGVVRTALSDRFRSNPGETGAALDMKSSGAMHPLSSEVVKACLPAGQLKPFRHNMMALMTVTGAKGSVVNFSQISCLLGQQELEGRRVPRMASGKTLPCFAPYDAGARSGGFVGDRFLTGLRPQEYYFHCMAGREGLVDTTVKTSRSGYLQRCLVKNLEPLRVGYDSTVRDDCDGSVVQFLYGEDGADPTAVGCLRTLPLLFYNIPQFAVQVEAALAAALPALPGEQRAQEEDKVVEAVKRRAKALLKGKDGKAGAQLPVNAQFFQSVMGVVPEGLQDALTDAIFGGMMLPPNPEGVDKAYAAVLKHLKKERATTVSSSRQKKGTHQKPKPTTFAALDGMDFQSLMHAKFYRSQAAPGEAVGVIAAQSVGEPSTQMTLNTFHMAGRGEANVTLGIPRLREILMTAAASIKTPVMTLPLRTDLPDGRAAAQRLAVRLKRIHLAEALRGLRVEENVVARTAEAQFGRGKTYTVRLEFHPPSAYPEELHVTFDEISKCFTSSFVPQLEQAVKVEVKKVAAAAAAAAAGGGRGGGGASKLMSAKISGRRGGGNGDDDDDRDETAAKLTSEDAAPKRKKRSDKDDDDENREENEEYIEGKLRFAGGRGEQATYGEGDEEDREIERQARKEAASRQGDYEGMEEEGGGGGGEKEKESAGGDRESDSDDSGSDGGSGDDNDDDNDKQKKKKTKKKEDTNATSAVIDASSYACEVVVTLPLDAPKILMREVVEKVAAGTVMRGVSAITKCYVLDASKQPNGCHVVQTDGINILGIWRSADLVDVDGITTNNPAAMLGTLGVEACRATIVREVSSVFGAYGIAVDHRHLSLIADHMTHMGGYRACNRIGIEASTSPFLKISFETAASFLVSATLHGDIDPLTSPAARIVLGKPVRMGTGAMDIVQDLVYSSGIAAA